MEQPTPLERAARDLIGCLEKLAMASSDANAASAACHYAGLLERSSPESVEVLLRDLRRDLATKSDLTDGLGQTGSYWDAFKHVDEAARNAMSQVMVFGRPDLGAVIGPQG